MLSEASAERVYLAIGATDLKKSINGLAAIVQEQFKLNPFSSCLFVFCNYRRDKIKILYWDHNVFWLYYRRLEKGRFQWPTTQGGARPAPGPRRRGWLVGLCLGLGAARRGRGPRAGLFLEEFVGGGPPRREGAGRRRPPPAGGNTPRQGGNPPHNAAVLEQQNAQLKAQLQRLQEQLLLAQKYRFGRSSERIVPGQLQFVFNEAEAEAKPEEKV